MTTTTTTWNSTTFADMTADDVTIAYRAADKSEKAAMRAAITAAIPEMVLAVAAGSADIAAVVHLTAVNAAMTAAPKAATVIDYAARVADHRATLVAAIAAIDAGQAILPDGVTIADDADFTGGTADPAAVSRFITVSGRKSGRGDVAAYVSTVMESAEGPLTIGMIRAAHTPSADYPKAAPSAGAIGAMFDRVEAGTEEVDFTIGLVNGKRGAFPAV